MFKISFAKEAPGQQWQVIGEAACFTQGKHYHEELGRLEADLVHWQGQQADGADALQLHPLDIAERRVRACGVLLIQTGCAAIYE